MSGMKWGLENKAVVITGGTDGIGKACAEKFLQAGCRVAVCGRSRQKLESVSEQWRREGFEVYTEAVNVADSGAVRRFAAGAAERFGRLDVWINNAGIYPQKQIMETEEAGWDEVMDTNLKAVFTGCKIAAGYMKEQKGGVILNASSIAAFYPSVGSGVYAVSKAAVLCLTKALAGELAPWNIRVAAYVPGLTATEMTREVLRRNESALVSQIPQRRAGTADEIASAVLFLASDAAAYITGTHLEISGGKLCVQNAAAAWEKAEEQ